MDEEIIESLVPVHAAVLERVRELAPALAGVDPDDPEAVLASPAKAQAARADLLALRRRWEALRRAWGVVVDDDTRASDYAVLRHPEVVWGDSWRGRRQTTARPWPSGALAFLVWLAQTDAGPWLPMPHEIAEIETEAVAEARVQGKVLVAG